ncbi:hypothetical protein LINGRAHAP2_LOCUS32076 [Linum grandiflorum]
MAATASFLHWNPLQWKHFPTRTSPLRSPFTLTTIKPSTIHSTSRFTLRCSFHANHLNADAHQNTAFQRVCDAAVKALQTLKKPAITALLIAALLMYGSSAALAASGGRMGGKAFSRSSSSSSSSKSYTVPSNSGPSFSPSSSSSSRSYTAPRNSGPSFSPSSSSSSRSYTAPPDSGPSFSRSSSSSSRSYTVPRDSGPSFSYSAPYYEPSSSSSYTVPRDSGPSFSYSAPYYEPSSSSSYTVPLDSGPSFSYSAPYSGPSPFGGSGWVLILVGFAALDLVFGFLPDLDEGGIVAATEKTSVLKLQVGLLGRARSLQKDLNKIAEVADTSSSQGLRYVLTETSLALLRHPDYCISAYSAVDVKRSMEDGEKRFNQLSIEERGKFDEETLVNVNSIKRQSSKTKRASGFSNEYIVITILVAAEGVHKLPAINSVADLKEALQKLGSIPSGSTLAVEVLWTPQNEDDTLTERELLQDYSLLRPL